MHCIAVYCPSATVLQLYIELNVSYELLPEEAQRLPARPGQAARQARPQLLGGALGGSAAGSCLCKALSAALRACL